MTELSIPNAQPPSRCFYCGGSGVCGYDDGPQFCGECADGQAKIANWRAERTAKQTWHVSTNTDVILLGGTVATQEEARRAADAILAMAESIPAQAKLGSLDKGQAEG